MATDISDQDTSIISTKTPLEAFPTGSLFITHGEKAGQEIPLTRDTFFIGRNKNNNLVFDDKSVSRKHAVINLIHGDYIISDLSSLKGTYVNGKKIEEAALKSGDMINIGENRMQFRSMSSNGRKSGGIWQFFIVLVLGIAIGGAAWFLVQKYYPERMPKQIMERIETHYTRGVELFNKQHDVDGARQEWKKILDLDPEMKTERAVNASILLQNTEPKKPAE